MSVVFPDGQVFPIRHYMTMDVYSVNLPAGTYEAEELIDLTRTLKSEFIGVKVVKQ